MVSKGNHPQMAEQLRFVKYCNLPRYNVYTPIYNVYTPIYNVFTPIYTYIYILYLP